VKKNKSSHFFSLTVCVSLGRRTWPGFDTHCDFVGSFGSLNMRAKVSNIHRVFSSR
jgi:hypothetical protein